MKFYATVAHSGFACLFAVSAVTAQAQTGGDANVPSLTLTPTGIKTLQRLVNDDAEAKACFEKIKTAADNAIGDLPDPVDVIQTEGKLTRDPVKIRTHKALTDMPKMQAFAYAYAVTQDPKYADAARRFVTAWAKQSKSQGDPINDTNLEPLIVAYDLTQATYSASERSTVDAYLRQVFAEEVRSGKLQKTSNNWNSHRLKIEGLIAFTLHDPELIRQVTDGYHTQVAQNLRPDGSSIDFEMRDALHYHAYDIEPLLTLAAAARNNGLDFYAYESPGGSSLKKSVAWFIPFETGEKTHAEFVNSKAAFDRKRAAAGEKEYVAGHPWNPDEGLRAIERAEAWDASLLPLTAKLAHSDAQRFPTWQTVLNAASR